MLHGIGESLQFTGDQKAETAAVAELAITIKADSPDLGEKVDQLQKQDKVFRDLQTQQVLFVYSLSFALLSSYPCMSEIWIWRSGWIGSIFHRPQTICDPVLEEKKR